jgi:hypothetical protein
VSRDSLVGTETRLQAETLRNKSLIAGSVNLAKLIHESILCGIATLKITQGTYPMTSDIVEDFCAYLRRKLLVGFVNIYRNEDFFSALFP